MADPTTQPLIQAPPGTLSSKEGPRVFVMAPRYRGGAAGAAMIEPKKEVPKAALVPPKPVPPPPPKPVMQKPSQGKPHGKVAVLIGIGVLLVLGLFVFVYFRFVKPAPVEPVPVPVVVEPPPTPPVVIEPPVTPPPTAVVTSPFPEVARPGTDSDSDGLTDIEEQMIYGTDPRLPDTDGDGFLDGNEVFHLYNPTGIAPGTLLAAGLAALYEPLVAVSGIPSLYTVLYPKVWSVTVPPEGSSDAVFVATTGESITLSVQTKTIPTQSLADWYVAQTLPAGDRSFTTKGGLTALSSEDQLTVWIDARGAVIVLHYDTGIKGVIDYLQTFKMMQNSLHVN